MDAILRAGAVYVFLVVVFRISGKRTLAEVTAFDFVLLLIISEATQQALLGEDFSITMALLVITTLVGLDIFFSLVQRRFKTVDRLMCGLPLVLVDNGKLLDERLKKVRVDEAEILHAARQLHGLERMDQVKYAVLETSGGISIVPRG
ncbi:MAG TPA: YetF domain-containing protein [Acidimicrobiales bacterium]|nr:YetF domain-containing protein [Acidimicrobiales bacterium]